MLHLLISAPLYRCDSAVSTGLECETQSVSKEIDVSRVGLIDETLRSELDASIQDAHLIWSRATHHNASAYLEIEML